jgi:hypothetical protein
MTTKIALLFAILGLLGTFATGASAQSSLFAARPKEGERMTYLMKGTNESWKYQVQAAGIVKKDSKGNLVEEYTWSHFVSNGASVALPPSGAQFREEVSLDPDRPPMMPNLSAAPAVLIGPITDLDTFYVDLWLASRLGNQLDRAGAHADLKLGTPGSWADGKRVVIGKSTVDFDFTVLKVDRDNDCATLLVKHVPPTEARTPLPAPWMREPSARTPNNWVQVTKSSGGFVAGAGKEIFDVRMTVSLADGRITSATMENLVKGQERDCKDAGLTNCGDAHSFEISRHIEISLMDQAEKSSPAR